MIAIIPARKGSKRLPGKNMMELCGKPLIYWTIQAALKAEFVRWVYVTTDCSDIAKYAEKFCSVRVRPKGLALDDSSLFEVAVDLLEYSDKEPSRAILLQPTSPLRDSWDIDKAIQISNVNTEGALVSVVSSCGSLYRRNGAIYIMNVKDLYNKHVDFDMAYIMEEKESIDIDTLEDFKEAERLMNERNKL